MSESTTSTRIPKTVNGLAIILGMGNIGDPNNYMVRFPTVESAKAYLSAYAKRGYRQLDGARNYPPGAPETCEPVMGEVLELINAEEKEGAGVLDGIPFIVDTKLRYKPPNTHSAELVAKSIRDSLEALRLDKVHIEYLHSIDNTSDTRETCRAMDEAFRAGKFEKFGLCNASVAQLDDFYKACEDQNLIVRPTVYQGDYNILSRSCEDGILEKARQYRMPFYAFSPAGGGLLNSKDYRERQGGRFDINTKMGQSYHETWYASSPLTRAAESLRDLSQTHDINGHHLALRWIIWHSNLSGLYGDGIILGSSSIEQLNSNLDAIESGPLPEEAAREIEGIWATLKREEKEANQGDK
ncbi:hypothetical protein V5O48_004289 [Marasmius crinis-equi]|uniref:NADP-dependent oxidoreductase domain-containing protein n=1 Tax=Marasmius crinis-equi TaxID=585013 RepID=A0ABR3FQG5_9AGAR